MKEKRQRPLDASDLLIETGLCRRCSQPSAQSNLANMNWRRGLLLAAINLLLAIPLVVSVERRDAAYVRDYYVANPTTVEAPPVAPGLAPETKSEAVSFMCSGLVHYPQQDSIVRSANMPAWVFTGWREVCPPDWSLSGRMHVQDQGPLTPRRIAEQRKVDLWLLLLIPLQWLLVGAYPLRQPLEPWREPGMFITICTTLAAALFFTPVFIGFMHWLAQLLSAASILAWFWWFGLLVWKSARSAWKWTARRLAANPI
jgi:hypothetical protein